MLVLVPVQVLVLPSLKKIEIIYLIQTSYFSFQYKYLHLYNTSAFTVLRIPSIRTIFRRLHVLLLLLTHDIWRFSTFTCTSTCTLYSTCTCTNKAWSGELCERKIQYFTWYCTVPGTLKLRLQVSTVLVPADP